MRLYTGHLTLYFVPIFYMATAYNNANICVTLLIYCKIVWYTARSCYPV